MPVSIPADGSLPPGRHRLRPGRHRLRPGRHRLHPGRHGHRRSGVVNAARDWAIKKSIAVFAIQLNCEGSMFRSESRNAIRFFIFVFFFSVSFPSFISFLSFVCVCVFCFVTVSMHPSLR